MQFLIRKIDDSAYRVLMDRGPDLDKPIACVVRSPEGWRLDAVFVGAAWSTQYRKTLWRAISDARDYLIERNQTRVIGCVCAARPAGLLGCLVIKGDWSANRALLDQAATSSIRGTSPTAKLDLTLQDQTATIDIFDPDSPESFDQVVTDVREMIAESGQHNLPWVDATFTIKDGAVSFKGIFWLNQAEFIGHLTGMSMRTVPAEPGDIDDDHEQFTQLQDEADLRRKAAREQ